MASNSLDSLCSCDSSTSFAFMSLGATDAAAAAAAAPQPQSQRLLSPAEAEARISSKYRLLPASDSPPVLRKKCDNFSAISGPLLPSAPILPNSPPPTIDTTVPRLAITPKERTGQDLRLQPLNTLDHIGSKEKQLELKDRHPTTNGVRVHAEGKRRAPLPPVRSHVSQRRCRLMRNGNPGEDATPSPTEQPSEVRQRIKQTTPPKEANLHEDRKENHPQLWMEHAEPTIKQQESPESFPCNKGNFEPLSNGNLFYLNSEASNIVSLKKRHQVQEEQRNGCSPEVPVLEDAQKEIDDIMEEVQMKIAYLDEVESHHNRLIQLQEKQASSIPDVASPQGEPNDGHRPVKNRNDGQCKAQKSILEAAHRNVESRARRRLPRRGDHSMREEPKRIAPVATLPNKQPEEKEEQKEAKEEEEEEPHYKVPKSPPRPVVFVVVASPLPPPSPETPTPWPRHSKRRDKQGRDRLDSG